MLSPAVTLTSTAWYAVCCMQARTWRNTISQRLLLQIYWFHSIAWRIRWNRIRNVITLTFVQNTKFIFLFVQCGSVQCSGMKSFPLRGWLEESVPKRYSIARSLRFVISRVSSSFPCLWSLSRSVFLVFSFEFYESLFVHYHYLSEVWNSIIRWRWESIRVSSIQVWVLNTLMLLRDNRWTPELITLYNYITYRSLSIVHTTKWSNKIIHN